MKKIVNMVTIICIISILFTACGKKEEIENVVEEVSESTLIETEEKEEVNEPTAEEKLQEGKFKSYAKMDLKTAEKFMEVLKRLESNNNSNYIVRFYDLGSNNIGFPMLISADLNAKQTSNYKAFELWLYDGENVNSFDYLKDTQGDIRSLSVNENSLIFRIGDIDIEHKKKTAGYIEYNINNGQISIVNKFFHYVFEVSSINSLKGLLEGTVLPDDKEYTLTADKNSPYNTIKYIDSDETEIYYADSNPNGIWMKGKQNVEEYTHIWASTYRHLLKENDTIYKFNTMEEFVSKSKELFEYYENTKYSIKYNNLFVIDKGSIKHSGTSQDVTLSAAISTLQEYIDLLKEVENSL